MIATTEKNHRLYPSVHLARTGSVRTGWVCRRCYGVWEGPHRVLQPSGQGLPTGSWGSLSGPPGHQPPSLPGLWMEQTPLGGVASSCFRCDQRAGLGAPALAPGGLGRGSAFPPFPSCARRDGEGEKDGKRGCWGWGEGCLVTAASWLLCEINRIRGRPVGSFCG